jgi:hypothetical protein
MSALMDENGLLGRLLDWAWAVIGVLVAVVWKSLNERISKKASAEAVAAAVASFNRHIEKDDEVHERILAKLDTTNAEIAETNAKLAEVVGELRAIRRPRS